MSFFDVRFSVVVWLLLHVWSFANIPWFFGVRVVINVAPFFDSSHHHGIWISIRYHVTWGRHSIASMMFLQQNIRIFYTFYNIKVFNVMLGVLN